MKDKCIKFIAGKLISLATYCEGSYSYRGVYQPKKINYKKNGGNLK